MFAEFVSHTVVLDTHVPIVYIGVLTEVSEAGFLLTDADVHDCRDGHATTEVYINEIRNHGITPNRKRVFVMRSAVMSVSRLDDVVEQ